jgi:hypothetical protein
MDLVRTVTDIGDDSKLQELASSYGIKIMNVSWEVCARSQKSCYKSNITDMTLNVNGIDMPVMRKPNFSDVMCEQLISKFKAVVGNERGSKKTEISFKKYLQEIVKYTGNAKLKSMYLPRDEKILTSSQTCFLPLISEKTEFNIKLYNNQSYNEPVVLVIVCSSEGTSAQIVKERECTLYFNKFNQNANYIAERLSDDKKIGVSLEGKKHNALLIFQIPLIKKVFTSLREYPVIQKVKKHPYYDGEILESMDYHLTSAYGSKCGNMYGPHYISSSEYMMKNNMAWGCGRPYFNDDSSSEETVECGNSLFGDDDFVDEDDDFVDEDYDKKTHGFEITMLKTSEGFGKFIGTDDKELIRDDKYPIHCTIQYYKVTNDSELSSLMMKEIVDQINQDYEILADEKTIH